MNEFCDDFLARSRFTRNQNTCRRRSDLLCQLQRPFHGGVFVNNGAGLHGKSRQNRANQLCVGGQRDVFFRPRFNRFDGGARVFRHAASHDGNANPFAVQPFDQRINVQFDIRHNQIRALTVAQCFQRLVNGFGMRDGTAFLQSDFACRADLSVHGSD